MTQWSTPGADLPAFANGVAQTSHQRVSFAGKSWEITLNGDALPCHPDGRSEFDGFFGANTDNAANYPGFPAAGGPSRPLSELASLHLRVGLTHLSQRTVDRRCSVHQGGHVAALILQNDKTGTTFFYQLWLHTENGPNPDLIGKPDPWRMGYWWWQGNNNQWGFDDSIRWYGGAQAGAGVRQVHVPNLLPRIKSLIALSTMPDKNPANYRVTGFYAGTVAWGHQTLSSRWDSVAVVQAWGETASTPADECLFAWAQLAYPEVLGAAPAAGTRELDVYRYRWYPTNDTYIGLSSADQRLYYVGPLSRGALLDLGPAVQWRMAAGCV